MVSVLFQMRIFIALHCLSSSSHDENGMTFFFLILKDCSYGLIMGLYRLPFVVEYTYDFPNILKP